MSYNSPYKKGDFFLSNKKKQEILVLDDVVIKNIHGKQQLRHKNAIRQKKSDNKDQSTSDTKSNDFGRLTLAQ